MPFTDPNEFSIRSWKVVNGLSPISSIIIPPNKKAATTAIKGYKASRKIFIYDNFTNKLKGKCVVNSMFLILEWCGLNITFSRGLCHPKKLKSYIFINL